MTRLLILHLQTTACIGCDVEPLFACEPHYAVVNYLLSPTGDTPQLLPVATVTC